MTPWLIRNRDQYHERKIQQALLRLFGAVEPWDVIMEAEARADQVAGKRPHRRGCITPGPWPLVSRELPSFMAKGGQIERRTADEVRREAAALAVRLDEKARRLDWAGQAQVTCWMAHCDTCGWETTHTGRGCSECRPRLGPIAKALQGRELCDLCHCPGAVVAVDSSDSYTTNVYHNVCARCLQQMLRGELARRPQEQGA